MVKEREEKWSQDPNQVARQKPKTKSRDKVKKKVARQTRNKIARSTQKQAKLEAKLEEDATRRERLILKMELKMEPTRIL